MRTATSPLANTYKGGHLGPPLQTPNPNPESRVPSCESLAFSPYLLQFCAGRCRHILVQRVAV